MRQGEETHLWDRYHYTAFVSYSRADKRIGESFQRAIERYRIPKPLVARNTLFGPVPKRLIPVFRDITDSSAAGDLGTRIQQALADSAFLIVLCSPHSAASRWVNVEIESYKRLGGRDRIIAILVDGDPVEFDALHAPNGAFPPALLRVMGADGQMTDEREPDPIAPDLRPQAEGFHYAVLKTVAAMIGLAPDILGQRQAEMERQERRAIRRVALAMSALAALAAASTFGAVRQLIAARINQSATYAGIAWTAIAEGKYDLAARIALQGLPAGDGLAIDSISPDAEDVVEAALWGNRTRLRFDAHRIERELIASIDVSKDGATAASVGLTGWLRVWNAATGEEKFVAPWAGRWMESFIYAAHDVELSPDGARFVTFGAQQNPENGFTACNVDLYGEFADDKWAKALGIVYEVATGCPLVALGASPTGFTPMNGFEWSPDGATILAFNWRTRHVGAFSAATGEQRFEFDTDADDPSAWGEDFSEGESAPEPIFDKTGGAIFSMRSKSTFAKIDAGAGATLATFNWPFGDDWPRSLFLAADDRHLIASAWSGGVVTYDAASGEILWRLEPSEGADEGLVGLMDLAVSPDGEFYAVVISDYETNAATLNVYRRLGNAPLWSASADRVKFSGDGSALVAFSRSEGVVYDPSSGAAIARLSGGGSPISAIVAAPGPAIVTGDEAGEIRVWNTSARSSTSKRAGVTLVAQGPGRRTIGILENGGTEVSIVDDAGAAIADIALEKKAVDLALDRAGKRFAVKIDNGPIEVRDNRGVVIASFDGAAIAAQGLSADGRRLAYRSAEGGLIVAVVETGAQIAEVAPGDARWFDAFLSEDGKTVYGASRTRVAAFNADGGALLWEYKGYKQFIGDPAGVKRLDLKRIVASGDGARILAIEDDSPNGEFAVDHAVLLDGADGRIVSILPFDAYESVERAAFSDDGSSLVTTGFADLGSIPDARLWDGKTGALRAMINVGTDQTIRAIGFTSDGGRFATVTSDGDAGVWAAATGRKIASLSDLERTTPDSSSPKAIIATAARAYVLGSNGGLTDLALPPARRGGDLANEVCAAVKSAGIERLSLEERAAAGISADQEYPCRRKGALSPAFYLEQASKLMARF